MGNNDTKKIAKIERDAHEWCTDIKPAKSQRREKRKERQNGKKEIKKQLKDNVN